KMVSDVHAGTCLAKIPHHFPGRYHEGSDQGPRAMANVFMLTFLRFAGLRQLRGMFAFENLHARFFVGADEQASLLVKAWCVHIQLTDVPCLGLKIGVV